jgi:hypothetical protein
MRRAVVHDPEQPCPGPLRFFRQPLVDQPTKWGHARRRFTSAHHMAPTNVPGGQLWQGPTALVCGLDRGRAARRGRQRGRATAAGREAGRLVGAQDGALGPQGLAVPPTRREVQNRSSLFGDGGRTWQDPVWVAPRCDGLRLEHPPHRAATARCAQRGAGAGGDVGQRLPTPRLLGCRDQLTSACRDHRMVQRGHNRPGGPVPACRPGKSPPASSGGATVAQHTQAAVPVWRRRGWTPAVVETRAAPGRRVAAAGTERSCAGPAVQLPPSTSMGTQGGGAGGDHAWQTSFGSSQWSDRHNASHLHNPRT